MAVQHHVVYSKDVDAAGVIAGGPFWCANALLGIAISACETTPELIIVPELVTITHTTALSGFIDPPSNLKNDRAWLFSGSSDTTVSPGVVRKLGEYYRSFIADANNVVEHYNIPAAHSFVTDGWGSPCGFTGSPYINDCSYDAAGAILQHAYNDSKLRLPVPAPQANLLTVDQKGYAPVVGLLAAGLAEKGFVYVPTGCAGVRRKGRRGVAKLGRGEVERDEEREGSGACRLHVAYHGCEQSVDVLNNTFVTRAGYNGWAEANRIVVLYPQATATPLNPKGCWDWWG